MEKCLGSVSFVDMSFLLLLLALGSSIWGLLTSVLFVREFLGFASFLTTTLNFLMV